MLLEQKLFEIANRPLDQQRQALVEELMIAKTMKREAIEKNIFADPLRAYTSRFEYNSVNDLLLQTVFNFAINHAFPLNKAAENDIALVAVGGCGRGEMAPFSDVDILFLIPKKLTKRHENIIEFVTYTLWDLRIKLGHSVRSISECIAEAKADITVRTSLVEKRFIAGDFALYQDLESTLNVKLFKNTVSEFIEKKLNEREKRHEKIGNARYVLEPNVKEAKGGLRDLHALYWIGKYIYNVETPAELAQEGYFEVDELSAFEDAESFLWNVRVLLHLINNRANEVLSFDRQIEIANLLGYKDTEHKRGVELFMRDYFRAARLVGELTRVFLTELEARHLGLSTPPNILANAEYLADIDGFEIINGRISYVSEDIILEDPLNIFRIFVLALQSKLLIHPKSFRWILRHIDLIDDDFRKNEAAHGLFMSALLVFGNPIRVLRRMNELGLLGAFIPEWAEIDALMQYNMYHSYTVDEHTIRTVHNFFDLEQGNMAEETPIVQDIVSKGISRPVMYLALLLHDIGKGKSRPHEDIGAEVALTVAPRFGLNEEETKLVSWLVQNHLEMSDAAQKRDLSDPKTIENFAKLVGSVEKLDLLIVLTVCDIRGVGPDVWNNWKAMLLRELYNQTKLILEADDMIFDNHKERIENAKKKLAAALSNWESDKILKETRRHYPEYWLGLDVSVQKSFAELILEVDISEVGIRAELDLDRDATRLHFVIDDHPGIFSRLCGAISLSSANIVDARTYTTRDALAVAVFWVQDANQESYPEAKFKRLEANVKKILLGEVKANELISDRGKLKKRQAAFKLPTKITFDNKGSEQFTIIEIDTRDRLGLLFDLSRALTYCQVSIFSAIAATYGEQAVDSFYVKDLFGQKIYDEAKQKRIIETIEYAINKRNNENG